MQILVAEDEKFSRALLSKVLTDAGHQVIEADNGIKAWELMQTDAIQLVVTDWVMPEMDGVEFCRVRIRRG
jgi:CheY-like chemotaxis protein